MTTETFLKLCIDAATDCDPGALDDLSWDLEHNEVDNADGTPLSEKQISELRISHERCFRMAHERADLG